MWTFGSHGFVHILEYCPRYLICFGVYMLNICLLNVRGKKRNNWTKVIAKGKHFLFLTRHPSCYSYSSSINVLLMKQGNTSTWKENDSLLFEKYIFRNICSSLVYIQIRVLYTSLRQNSPRNQSSTYRKNSD
jgi:hypothetical protein